MSGFGINPTTSAPSGFSFGQLKTTGSGFSFAQTTSSVGTFGLTSQAPMFSSSGGGLGFGFSPGAASTSSVMTTAASTGFSFFDTSTSAPSSAPAFSSFSFSTPSTASSTASQLQVKFSGPVASSAGLDFSASTPLFSTTNPVMATCGTSLFSGISTSAPFSPRVAATSSMTSTVPFGTALPLQSLTTTTTGFSFNSGTAATPSSSLIFSSGTSSSAVMKPSDGLVTSVTGPISTTGAFSFGLGGSSGAMPGFNLTTSQPTSSSVGFAFTSSKHVAPATTSGFSFMSGSTSIPASSASVTPAAPGNGFNLSTSMSSAIPVTSTGLQLGGGFSLGISTTSVGSPMVLSTAGSSGGISSSAGFSFATSCAASTVVTTSVAFVGLGGTAPISTALTAPLGLGGDQSLSLVTGLAVGGMKADGVSPKELPLPKEIMESITIFEDYKSTEKTASEENNRQTDRDFHKLGEVTRKLRQYVLQLANQYSQLQAAANKLKSRVMEEAENVEMARRTKEMSMARQGDNKAPEQYFLKLVRSFEERMKYCRTKIEEVELCNRAANGSLGSPADICEVLRKEHDAMKVLAANVYTLHNKLVFLHEKLNCPSIPKPEALFKQHTPDDSSNPSPSSILRPCLGDGGSGLMIFQAGQEKAKAVSFTAAPPTLSLTQAQQPSFFGSSSIFPSTPFGTSANTTTSAFSFNSPSTTPFGISSSGGFGQSPFGSGSSSGFGSSGTSLFSPSTQAGSPFLGSFGSPKPFGT